MAEMDEMAKGRSRKGKWCANFMFIKKSCFVWGGKGRKATVQGLIVTKFKCKNILSFLYLFVEVGATDRNYLRCALKAKATKGVSLADVENEIVNWIADGSILSTDSYQISFLILFYNNLIKLIIINVIKSNCLRSCRSKISRKNWHVGASQPYYPWMGEVTNSFKYYRVWNGFLLRIFLLIKRSTHW